MNKKEKRLRWRVIPEKGYPKEAVKLYITKKIRYPDQISNAD